MSPSRYSFNALPAELSLANSELVISWVDLSMSIKVITSSQLAHILYCAAIAGVRSVNLVLAWIFQVFFRYILWWSHQLCDSFHIGNRLRWFQILKLMQLHFHALWVIKSHHDWYSLSFSDFGFLLRLSNVHDMNIFSFVVHWFGMTVIVLDWDLKIP